MKNLRDRIHEAIDEQRFSSSALLARIMTEIELPQRARSYRWAPIVAGMLTLTIVASLLVARATHNTTITPNAPSNASSQCESGPTAIPTGQDPLASISQYPVPASLVGVSGVSSGPNSSLWSIGHERNGSSVIVKVSTSGTFTEYPTPNGFAEVKAITKGPDGNLWFAEAQAMPSASVVTGTNVGRVAKMTPSGAVTEYTIGASPIDASDITTGPDCNLWITDRSANGVVKLTPSGIGTEYPIPTPDSGPGRITTGPDGNLWLTESFAGKVARVTTAGSITEFPLPPDGASSNSRWLPIGITAGLDGNLWVTAAASCCAGGGPGEVLKITPSGAVNTYPIPRVKAIPGQQLLRDPPPGEITLGSDGNLWFYALNNVDRVSTGGVISQYTISSTDGVLDLNGLVTGPDGNLWFTGSCLCATNQSMVGKFGVRQASV